MRRDVDAHSCQSGAELDVPHQTQKVNCVYHREGNRRPLKRPTGRQPGPVLAGPHVFGKGPKTVGQSVMTLPENPRKDAEQADW